MPLLTQNRELKQHRIYNFSIPAWYVRINGKVFKTCPNAGSCAQVCYARNGTYMFSNVLAAHTKNLLLTLEQPQKFIELINAELQTKKFQPTKQSRTLPEGILITENKWLQSWIQNGGAAVRIHDAGDFYSETYLYLWFQIASQNSDVLFYAYTKEVELLQTHGINAPDNFHWLYSTGGIQDHLIKETERRADVFPNEQAITDAGYSSQDASDLLAILLPSNLIGISANNIPRFNKKMDGKRFSEL